MKRFCRPSRLVGAVVLGVFLISPVSPAAAQLSRWLPGETRVGGMTLPRMLFKEAAAQPKKLRTIEGITEYQLSNGLQVLLYPDQSSSRVTVNMTVLVGSRHEGYGETGMAHLLEHMVFKGTPTHPEVPKSLRDHGASFNGTTWVDRTNYFETMPASDKNLEFAIRLEADRLVNSFIKREDLASEMTVVRNEFEAGENDPSAILGKRMIATAYEWHNYGKSTIGNRSDIERVPIENLQAFYRKHYQPDNVVLIIAGRFDDKKALEYIGKYFGTLPKPERILDKTYTEEPAQDGDRNVVLRRVGKVGAVGAVYHIPAAAHPDFAACEVLANLLDYEPNGHLYKALVTTKKATGVGSFAAGYHDPGVIQIQVGMDRADEASIVATRDAMLDVVENLHKVEITKEEVERVKTKLLKQRELQMSDANRIGIVLSDWASKGDWRLFFLHRDRLEKVTPADVTRVAKQYFQRSNRTAGVYIPSDQVQRTPVAETPDVAKLVDDYKGREAVAAGETFDPTPQNIEKRVRRLELPSGVKAALLSKKTRGENVVAQLTLRFGNEKSLRGFEAAPDMLGDMLLRGTKSRNRQQLEDELDKLKAQVNASSDPGQVTFSIQCKRENLPRVLALLEKVLREPSFPADEFDVLKRQALEHLEKSLTEPTALAAKAMRRKIQPYPKESVLYVPTFEEDIARFKALTPDQVRQLYEEQLSGAHGELVVVGDFDADAVAQQVGAMLKDWTSKTEYRWIARKSFPDIKGGSESINTPDKANALYVAGQTMALKDDNPDVPALQIGNYLLGGAGLASRISNRVRGKEGLSYGAGSQVQVSPVDESAVFMVFAICNPENIDKVDKAISEELDKFFKSGVTDKEVSEGVKAYLQSQQNGRASDSTLARLLATGLRSDKTFADVALKEQRIAALTPDEVMAAVRKHLDPKRLVIVRGGDFKKTSEKPPQK